MNIRDEDRDEAKRLKLLPLAQRQQVLEFIQSIADNPKIPDEDRREARTRSKALAHLLRLKLKKKNQ